MHPADLPVVLLDEQHRPVGQLPKSEVHHAETPLHLAFSSYVFDEAGRLLLTRRAPGKRAWPGVWTNSCCGHPLPDEALPDAIARRLRDELGLTLLRAEPLLPDFAYRAVAPDGIVENEFCPVFAAAVSGEPTPDPDEVLEFRWESWASVVELVRVAPWSLSPWAALQIPRLDALGPTPWQAVHRPAA